MKWLGYILGALALVFAIVSRVDATANVCAITGTLQNVDSTPCANCTVTFNSLITQVVNGLTFQPVLASTTTDNSGNLTQISLPQGLTVQITVSENGQTFAPYQAIVPFTPAVSFDQLNQGFLLEPLNALASLQPPTGPLSMNNQQITNLACPTGPGGALAWGCNAVLGNLTINGGFQQNTSGFGMYGVLTVSTIGNPSAPTVVAEGVTGSTSYTYYLACHDGNGGTTLESAGTTITNGNAALSSINYNQVAFTIPAHAVSCDVLNSPTTSAIGGLGLTASPFKDTSNANAAYSQPSRNTTGDGIFGGNVSVDGTLGANAATVSGNVSIGGNVQINGTLNAFDPATFDQTILVEGNGGATFTGALPQITLDNSTLPADQKIKFIGQGSAHIYGVEVDANDTFKLVDNTSGQNLLVVDQSTGAINFPQGMESTVGGNITTSGGTLPGITCNGSGSATMTPFSTLNSGSFTVASGGSPGACTLTFPIACANALNCSQPSDTAGTIDTMYADPLSTSSVLFGQNSGSNLGTHKISYVCGCN